MKIPGGLPGFILLLVSTPTPASDIESRILACRSIDNDAKKISCYDAIADSISTSSAVASTINAEDSKRIPVVIETTASDQSKLPVQTPAMESAIQPEELFGKSDSTVTEIVTKELEITTLDQISSKVVKVQRNSRGGFIVHLENGQIWKQKGGAGAWRIKEGEVAVISKASLGSFMMKADGRNRRTQAERIR